MESDDYMYGVIIKIKNDEDGRSAQRQSMSVGESVKGATAGRNREHRTLS